VPLPVPLDGLAVSLGPQPSGPQVSVGLGTGGWVSVGVGEGVGVGVGLSVVGSAVGDGLRVRVGVGFGVYDGSGSWPTSFLVASTNAGAGNCWTSMPCMIRCIVAVQVFVGYSAPK
jgi:hypothetical protein